MQRRPQVSFERLQVIEIRLDGLEFENSCCNVAKNHQFAVYCYNGPTGRVNYRLNATIALTNLQACHHKSRVSTVMNANSGLASPDNISS